MVIVSVSWEGAVEKVSVSCHSLAFQNPRSMVTVLSPLPLADTLLKTLFWSFPLADCRT